MHHFLTRSTAAFVLVPTFGLWMAAGTPSVAQEEPFVCRGLAATHVGTPGSEVGGTDGADVIVSNGAADVFGDGGDDTICATNVAGTGVDDRVHLDAGDGDDVVDTLGNEGVRAFADLGEGDDRFVGGDESDFVDAAGYPDEPLYADGTDIVSTGAGNDLVTTGGDNSAPDGDTIKLGPGADEIKVNGVFSGARWAGGIGPDLLTVERLGGTDRWVFHNNGGGISQDNEVVASMTSFTKFNFWAGRASELWFIGSAKPETIRTMVPLDDVRLGPGDDRVQMWPDELADSTEMRVFGQSGVDTLHLGYGFNDGDVDLNLLLGTLRFARPAEPVATSTTGGFEQPIVFALWARVVGTNGDDNIRWDACHGSMTGRRGDDTFTYRPSIENDCGNYQNDADFTIRGGYGDDTLIGGALPDRLYGGAGADVADGRGHTDLCRAEITRHCENP